MKRKENFSGQQLLVLPPAAIKLQQNDVLTQSLYITDIGYYPKADEHSCHRPTPIDQYILLYCVDGSGICSFNDQIFDLHEGQYIIIPESIPHFYEASPDNPWSIYWIHFNGRIAKEYTYNSHRPHNVITNSLSSRNNIFDDIFNALSNSLSLDNLRYVSSLLHHYLASLSLQRKVQIHHDVNPDISVLIEKYVTENLANKISLFSLSEYLGVSPMRLNTFFKSHMHCSPMEYINVRRLEKACDLLTNSNLKINQLCYKVGVYDCYYFSRQFKKLTGMSPKEYRLTHRRSGD